MAAATAGTTRADLAVLHDWGASPGPQTQPVGPPDLAVERSDLRTVNTVTLQFVSLTPSNAVNVPRTLDRVFLRFRFFDFEATQTPVYAMESTQLPGSGQVCIVL